MFVLTTDHGADSRETISAKKLATYDVVITAYPTVSGELAVESQSTKKKKGGGEGGEDDYSYEPVKKKGKKRNGKLFDVKWKRVILDEVRSVVPCLDRR